MKVCLDELMGNLYYINENDFQNQRICAIVYIIRRKGAVSNDIRFHWSNSSYLYWSREIRYEAGDCTFKLIVL